MTDETAVVELDRADLGYGRRRILRNVSLILERGDLAVLLGSNGAGKTTLIRTVLGELRLLYGSITRCAGLRLGYVPQLNATGECWPMEVRGFLRLFSSRGHRTVGPVLAAVGMSGLARASLQELSGGQRQRVMLARALLNEPELLLLDEPTQSMDPAAEQSYLSLLAELNCRGTTMLVVTHLHHVARSLARRVLVAQDGGIRETAPSVLTEPQPVGADR